MENTLNGILVLISPAIAYFIGAIPTSVLIGKYYYGMDVRDHGSKNPGATNTFRVLGKKAGSIVMAMDILKGFLPAFLPYLFQVYIPGSAQFTNMQLILGMLAVLGHIFPITSSFRGGKGIAAIVGMMLAIQPLPTLACIAIFLVILQFTHYVSLGSMVASFVLFLLMIFKDRESLSIYFCAGIFILIICTHFKNIGRLIRGEENKIYLYKKKNQG